MTAVANPQNAARSEEKGQGQSSPDLQASELQASELQTGAGGPDGDHFDWKEVWYPVAYLRDLDKKQLTRFTLLEADLVIWWDSIAQCWRAFSDQCPHRMAPLSEGRINESGLLECPYHGWSFSGDGNCEAIPQQVASGQAHQSKRACVRSFATQEHQGFLFVYRGTLELAEQVALPTVGPIEEDTDDWVIIDTFRDIPYDALTLMENVLDSSHIPYTHHKSVGNRSNVSPVELELLSSNKFGFKGFWKEGPRKGTLGSQHTTFVAPSLMWHDLTSKQFGRTLTVVYATPIRKGECRLFARFPFKFSSKIPKFFIKLTPTWYAHIGQNGVLEDDQVFLHYQERYIEKAGGSEQYSQACYLPTKADRFVLELRRWVSQFGAESFPGQTFDRATPKHELLERFHSHTKHCSSCLVAYRNFQRARWAIGVLAMICWSLTPILATNVFDRWGWSGPVAGGVSLALVAAWVWLGTWEKKFVEGRVIPPRNLPEKP